MSNLPIKVVPVETRTKKRNEGVATTLQNFLDIVSTENLTGIAIAAVDAQGFTHCAFEGGENIATLIGSVARLQKRLLDFQEG